MEHNYYVYIATNKNNTVLYIGVTNNLERRMAEHREKVNKGFTSKYNVNKLVYYEHYTYINEAIHREKQLKKWKREWKIRLIEEMNETWSDLLCGNNSNKDCLSREGGKPFEEKAEGNDGLLPTQE